MTISGLETALFRASLSHKGVSEYDYFGGKLLTIETDITIPYLTDFEVLKKWMNYTFKRKFTIYKLKVSGNINEDKKFISQVYGFLKNHIDTFTIRLDGNQGFTKKHVSTFSISLSEAIIQLSFLNNPCRKTTIKG